MTARDTINSIQPGSIPHGERGGLEAGLQEVLGGQAGGASGGGGGVAPASPLPSPNDPLGALLGGQVPGDANLPVTDGLSVGAGAAPISEADPMLSDRASKLRAIATEASSPMLRAAARGELRRMARGLV